MTPESVNKLKSVFNLVILSMKAAQIIRGFGMEKNPRMPLKDKQFLALHKRAVADLEAGTFSMERFEKELEAFYEQHKPKFESGGVHSGSHSDGPFVDGGEFIVPVKRKP